MRTICNGDLSFIICRTPTSLSVDRIYGKMTLTTEDNSDEQWLPIDDTEVTVAHRLAQQLPCAFATSMPKGKEPKRGAAIASSSNQPSKRFQQQQKTTVASMTRAKYDNEKRSFVQRQNVDKAKMKDQQRSEQIEQKRRADKNRRKREARARKNPNNGRKSTKPMIGDTIDPYDAFDADGNIMVNRLIGGGGDINDETTMKKHAATTANNNNYATYVYCAYKFDAGSISPARSE